jgi:hypothetical protein
LPTGLSPSLAAPPRVLRLPTALLTRSPLGRERSMGVQPPGVIGRPSTQTPRFGLLPVRSPLLGESQLISWRTLLRCFRSRPGLPAGSPLTKAEGFPHSDSAGSKDARLLPRTFRRRAPSFFGLTSPGHSPSAVCLFALQRALALATSSLSVPSSLGKVLPQRLLSDESQPPGPGTRPLRHSCPSNQVEMKGFEPSTSSVQGRRSPN